MSSSPCEIILQGVKRITMKFKKIQTILENRLESYLTEKKAEDTKLKRLVALKYILILMGRASV